MASSHPSRRPISVFIQRWGLALSILAFAGPSIALLYFLAHVHSGIAAPAPPPARESRQEKSTPPIPEADSDLTRDQLFEQGAQLEGTGDPVGAAKAYAEAGAMGSAYAYLNLGLLQSGTTAVADPNAAATSFAHAYEAAGGEYPEAAWRLAACYDQGMGVPKNSAFAKEIRDQVLHGDHRYQYWGGLSYIADLLARGEGGSPDPMGAYQLLKRFPGTHPMEAQNAYLDQACKAGLPEATKERQLLEESLQFDKLKIGSPAWNAAFITREEKRAAAGDFDAMGVLAQQYERHPDPNHPSLAADWIHKALQAPAPKAWYWTEWGTLQFKGLGTPKDCQGGFQSFLKAARLDPSYSGYLGQCYEHGWGTSADPLLAGISYLKTFDYSKAEPVLQAAVRRKEPGAWMPFGEVEQAQRAYQSAEDAFMAADAEGDPGAALALGKLYLFVETNPEARSEAESLRPDRPHRHAVRADDPAAHSSFAPPPSQPPSPLPWLRKAAAKGSLEAYILLGLNRMGDSLDGVPAPLARAASQGNPRAALACVRWAWGSPKDPDALMDWLKTASAYRAMHSEDWELESLDEVCRDWALKIAPGLYPDNGDEGEEDGGEVASTPAPPRPPPPPRPPGDLAMARAILKVGAEARGADCWMELARIYELGLGVPKDEARSLYCRGREKAIQNIPKPPRPEQIGHGQLGPLGFTCP